MGLYLGRGEAYIREENHSICNLLNLLLFFLFSSKKLVFSHISRRARCKICSKLTIKTPEYIKLKVTSATKTITYQNVSSVTQVKNFFISFKYVPFSRYSSFCTLNHPKIYKISDVMMSISSWDRLHFWIHLLNHSLLSHQTWSIDRYKQGK